MSRRESIDDIAKEMADYAAMGASRESLRSRFTRLVDQLFPEIRPYWIVKQTDNNGLVLYLAHVNLLATNTYTSWSAEEKDAMRWYREPEVTCYGEGQEDRKKYWEAVLIEPVKK